MKNLTQQELKKGTVFFFDNTEHQDKIKDDDIRGAKVWFENDNSKHTWRHGFKIQFNGVLLHHSKTFSLLENRLNKLIEKWKLKQSETDLGD